MPPIRRKPAEKKPRGAMFQRGEVHNIVFEDTTTRLIITLLPFGGFEVRLSMDPYEELSFENMVLFYRDELKEVREGAEASEVLSKKDIKLLKSRRIVYLTFNGHGISQIVLTRKAQEILEKNR
jgi:hypothetical protein